MCDMIKCLSGGGGDDGDVVTQDLDDGVVRLLIRVHSLTKQRWAGEGSRGGLITPVVQDWLYL